MPPVLIVLAGVIVYLLFELLKAVGALVSGGFSAEVETIFLGSGSSGWTIFLCVLLSLMPISVIQDYLKVYASEGAESANSQTTISGASLLLGIGSSVWGVGMLVRAYKGSTGRIIEFSQGETSYASEWVIGISLLAFGLYSIGWASKQG